MMPLWKKLLLWAGCEQTMKDEEKEDENKMRLEGLGKWQVPSAGWEKKTQLMLWEFCWTTNKMDTAHPCIKNRGNYISTKFQTK